MKNQTKILIVRFSSIGDIVLTSPIIRCLRLQKKNVEIHFITKEKYKDVLALNPYLDKVHHYKDNYFELIKKLKDEKYDIIIDLHNNLRSIWLRLNLRTTSYVFKKENFKKFLIINFGINFLKSHTVTRYFEAIKTLGVVNDKEGLDYFIEPNYNVPFDINQQYIAWCIGGSYNQKKLSSQQIIEVCDRLESSIVLLGGEEEKKEAAEIINKSKHNKLYNLCGELTLSESAYLVKNSSVLLTNDTSLMHIGAAFKTPTISFWGCTKPVLGFSPYLNQHSFELSSKYKNPCSKHGQKCKYTLEGCVKSINSDDIYNKIEELDRLLIK